MEVIGIICEYNPFHNGHLYHIRKIKELYKDSIIVLVLNGYFMQRGELSVLSKEDKTKIALDNNIDIVLELPFIYGTQGSDIFADISIKMLNELKATKIIFGSEKNDISLLEKIVDIQLNDKSYDDNVKRYLSEGLNYPTAMSKALNINCNFNNPNDLLGISYIKSIKKNNFNIVPISIKRTSSYHDINSNDDVISASNIRNKINTNKCIDNYLPIDVIKYIKNVNYNHFFELLKYKIITDHNLNNYLTVDEGIENKLKKDILNYDNINDYRLSIKTKRYTYNKINRMFIHILVGLLKSDNKLDLDYIRVLGFNANGRNYLSSIKKDISIPLKVNHDSKTYAYELKASLLYDLLTNSNTYEFELRNKPIVK